MAKSTDPILLSIRRACAVLKNEQRRSKPRPPAPAPDDGNGPPSPDSGPPSPPPAPVIEPAPPAPVADPEPAPPEPERIAAFNRSPVIDSEPVIEQTIEGGNLTTGLDWLIRRKSEK